MRDLRSWVARWNDASLMRIAAMRGARSHRRWPMLLMFAIGLVAGAGGSYAVMQRAQIKRLAKRAFGANGEQAQGPGLSEATKPEPPSFDSKNHRREAAMEAT